MRDAKAIVKTRTDAQRTAVATGSLVLLVVVVLITSITGAAAPV